MDLNLLPAEASLLYDVLSNHLSDLRTEILHTKRHELREDLKGDAAMVRAVIARLEGELGAKVSRSSTA